MVESCGLYEISFQCEMTNNTTIMVEVSIGIIAAIILSVAFYKIQEAQREKIDGIIRKQDELRQKRIGYVVSNLSIQLNSAMSYISEILNAKAESMTAKEKEIMINGPIFAKINLENASNIVSNTYDVIDPELLKKIRNILRAGLFYCTTGFFPDTDEEDYTYDFEKNWLKDAEFVISDLEKILLKIRQK